MLRYMKIYSVYLETVGFSHYSRLDFPLLSLNGEIHIVTAGGKILSPGEI